MTTKLLQSPLLGEMPQPGGCCIILSASIGAQTPWELMACQYMIGWSA